MRTTWILAADAARARVFEIPGARRPMREIRDFLNPEGRAQNRELVTAAPPGTSPAEHEEELFAVELSDYLDNARAQGLFQVLHVIATPKLLGMLRRHLHEPTRKLIGKEIAKDLSRSEAKEIEAYVRGNPEFELEGGYVSNVPKR